MACDIHPFEKSGLGLAPFRFVGLTESTYQAAPGAPVQPGTSCDYCSTAIKYVCRIRSADGREFKVGCDCVLKLDRADNRLVTAVEAAQAKLDKARRQAKKAAQTTREAGSYCATFARLDASPELQAACKARPHPMIPGLTLFDYICWMRPNAGHSGLVRAARMIDSLSD